MSASAGFGGRTGSSQVNGTATTMFTWIPDNPYDYPPQSAIIVEDVAVNSSSESYSNFTSSTSASNGMGSQPVTSSGYQTAPIPSPPYYVVIGNYSRTDCAGTRARIVAGGNTITVAGPTVSGTATGNKGYSTGATYSVTATPAILVPNNVVDDDGILYGEIGRRTSASLTSTKAGLSFANFAWSVTGRTFKDYRTSGGTGEVDYLTSSDLAQPVPFRYWKAVTETEETISVDATVLYNGESLGRISAERKVIVEVPTRIWSATTSNLSRIVNYGLWSDGNPLNVDAGGEPKGIVYSFGGRSPKHFPGSQFKCAQLVAADWYAARSVGSVERTTNGRFDLDSSYPYRLVALSYPFSYGGQAMPTEDVDTPAFVSFLPAYVTVETEFEIVLMYQSSDPSARDAPLHSQFWSWNGDTSGSAPASPTKGGEFAALNHPTWQAVFTP